MTVTLQLDPRVERVESTMALIGARWCPAIMFALILQGTKRFSELRRVVPGVSQRMLTKQLRDLERSGLVRRVFREAVPPRVEYSATELGLSLGTIYKSVCTWTERNENEITAARAGYDSDHPERRNG